MSQIQWLVCFWEVNAIMYLLGKFQSMINVAQIVLKVNLSLIEVLNSSHECYCAKILNGSKDSSITMVNGLPQNCHCLMGLGVGSW